jgi:hypothetical protein
MPERGILSMHSANTCRSIAVLALSLFLSGARLSVAQLPAASGESILPQPSGPFAIGRVTYHWIDSARRDVLSRDSSAPREIMVDVWYPAERKEGPAASYLPHLSVLRRVLADSVLERRFAPAFSAVTAGRLVTHAVEGAPARCPPRGCALLLFSHGGGVDRSLYTTQFQDFASHGYVVAAIAHTYLTHTVVFPDGRVIRLQDRRSLDAPPSDSNMSYWRRRFAESAAINQVRYAHAAADVRFVLDQMIRHARESALHAPFVGRLDLDRIGALGHSMGGLAAAIACRSDTRIKACMNQDGTNDGLPADRDSAGRTLSQPFMYFGRVEAPSRPRADSVLARIEMTRQEDDSIRRSRPREQDSLLADVTGGAWRLRLKMPRSEHMSFSDELLIEAAGDTAERADALQVLGIVHRYTRAFFDKTLRGRSDTPLDRPIAGDPNVIVLERFRPHPGRR